VAAWSWPGSRYSVTPVSPDTALAVLRGPEYRTPATVKNIERNAKNPQYAYENIIWAPMNTKEFILVQ